MNLAKEAPTLDHDEVKAVLLNSDTLMNNSHHCKRR